MELIKLLVIIILFGINFKACAADKYQWINSSIEGITSFINGCIEVPEFTGVGTSSTTLNLQESGEWVPTGQKVSATKLLEFKVTTQGVSFVPKKYKVLYRIDPRFRVPQVFIQERKFFTDSLGNQTEYYASDLHNFQNGRLLKCQYEDEYSSSNYNLSQCTIDASSYIEYYNRNRIAVEKNDVINITIDSAASYFGPKSQMRSEFDDIYHYQRLHTTSLIPDNRIIYTDGLSVLFSNISSLTDHEILLLYTGRPRTTRFRHNKYYISTCYDGKNDRRGNVCYYNNGRGVKIYAGSRKIKDTAANFIKHQQNGKYFFYHKSDSSGYLQFTTDWDIAGMYIRSDMFFKQFMSNWNTMSTFWRLYSRGSIYGYSTLKHYFELMPHNMFDVKFLHFGRYFFDVEIGNSTKSVTQSDLDEIKVEYKIMQPGRTPSDSEPGIAISKNSRGDAYDSGDLWVRVTSNNKTISGSVIIKAKSYIGATWFSDIVYNHLLVPLRLKINELSEIFYTKLVSNVILKNIASAMLIIYIILYGLMFLAGATQITTTDIVTRVLKIALIVALFSPQSWTFFNQNLFHVFIYGIDDLFTNIVGVTSNTTNLFGFIDPIVDRYTNPKIWALLFIQLLQIHTGLTFFAIITIYSMLIFLRSLMAIIVTYCLAFLGLAIMISLAPLFIILILFERTKSIFDNWISIMFSYMIQPTILLLFFLIIEQILSEQIRQVVVTSCWKLLIPLEIAVDLGALGIPVSFSFSLPFLGGIYFFAPEVDVIESIRDFYLKPGTFAKIATSSLLFFVLSKLTSRLVDYSSLVVQYLTNVLAARQYGKLQKYSNPVHDILSDMDTGTSRKIKNFAKEKFFYQKISHRTSSPIKDIDYGAINRERNNEQDPNSQDNNEGQEKSKDQVYTGNNRDT